MTTQPSLSEILASRRASKSDSANQIADVSERARSAAKDISGVIAQALLDYSKVRDEGYQASESRAGIYKLLSAPTFEMKENISRNNENTDLTVDAQAMAEYLPAKTFQMIDILLKSDEQFVADGKYALGAYSHPPERTKMLEELRKDLAARSVEAPALAGRIEDILVNYVDVKDLEWTMDHEHASMKSNKRNRPSSGF